MYVLTDPFMYSTSSAAECESPKPALTLMYGSVSDQLAERHELVHAQIVGLHGVPRVVKVGGRLSCRQSSGTR